MSWSCLQNRLFLLLSFFFSFLLLSWASSGPSTARWITPGHQSLRGRRLQSSPDRKPSSLPRVQRTPTLHGAPPMFLVEPKPSQQAQQTAHSPGTAQTVTPKAVSSFFFLLHLFPSSFFRASFYSFFFNPWHPRIRSAWPLAQTLDHLELYPPATCPHLHATTSGERP